MPAHQMATPTASTISTFASTNSIVKAVNPTARVKRRKGRVLKPSEVSKAAARVTAATKTAARGVLQDMGVAPTDEQIRVVLETYEYITTRRVNRQLQNAEARLGHRVRSTLPALSGRAAVCLPTGPLPYRLHILRVRAVQHVANNAFRHGASGGSSFRVMFATTSNAVDYQVSIGSNRDTYRGAFKGWSAMEDHHRVTVPKDWRLRVLHRGLSTIDGMMTLDAHALESPTGVVLYAAVWASQGRGYAVCTHRGFIALCEGEAYHSDTAKGAIAGARRKARAAGRPSTPRISPYTIGVDEFVRRYGMVDCDIRLDDARASGSCEFGIRSWCNAVDLNYDEGRAPLHVVLAAFRQRPQIEVRRAIVHAVRRHRLSLRETVSRRLATVPQHTRIV